MTRTEWAALVAAGIAGAGVLAWFSDRAPYPYAQRRVLDVPLPLLSPARLATVLAPRTGQRVLEIGPGTGPAHQEKIVKFNELLANCVIYGTACDITAVVNAFTADGHPVDPDDLATVVPYITHTVRRFGDWVLDLSAPQALPVTRARPHARRPVQRQLTPPPGNPPARGVRECGAR